jgi:hypothetical protein
MDRARELCATFAWAHGIPFEQDVAKVALALDEAETRGANQFVLGHRSAPVLDEWRDAKAAALEAFRSEARR